MVSNYAIWPWSSLLYKVTINYDRLFVCLFVCLFLFFFVFNEDVLTPTPRLDGLTVSALLLSTLLLCPSLCNDTSHSFDLWCRQHILFVFSTIIPTATTGTSSPSSSVVFLQAYRRFLCRVLQTRVIQPLCREIETNLRLHIHTKVTVIEL